jgi:exopolysaccharide biosynthesis protein
MITTRRPFFYIIISLILINLPAFAQQDSIAFVTAQWKKQKISRGVVWKQCLFKGNLFGSNQNINILEVKQRKKTSFTIGYDSKILKPTSEFGTEAKAMAALNGTFFNMKEGGSVDFIKAGGKVINDNRLKDNARIFHQGAAIAIQKGKLRIEKWNGNAGWESELRADEIMVSGPLLIFQRNREPLDSSSFNVTRHPRTIVAETQSKKILMITVDGRSENAAGMNLFELQSILRWLNTRDGLNLDGGGSTTLWIYNQPENGVVNYPSDNKTWDHQGERKVANVLLLKKH